MATWIRPYNDHWCEICEETFSYQGFRATHKAANGDTHAIFSVAAMRAAEPVDFSPRTARGENDGQ